ncbi:HNH endonuclease signature motif containing protein [Bacillus toyonensis]|uniref:HNH endonuclease signature motif containing protein n=1 Tax=Bacillus toyonensis TaxID=155322 RepID=UPI000BEB480A|nr:HNH endonuclease signature motif containing protein [Bacillus toyonensis]PEB20710.1 hypothetical protein COO05_31705 [Bacillus toyonensis]
MIYFKKSLPAPDDLIIESKKKNGNYATPGVLAKLKEDFYDKCYICEYKKPTTINVEHLRPHKNNDTLKYDWLNLFLSCSHCNNIKLHKYENMLNCTVPDEDIENLIKVSMHIPLPTKKVEVEALSTDPKVLETVELLDKVYNGTTPMKAMESYYIRESLVKELLKFITNLNDYLSVETTTSKEYYKMLIEEQLHSSSPFTMFKRWIIKESPELIEEFSPYMVATS